ncbi:structural protein [Brucella phage EF4]|uniref:Structural protein n=1 Tax=Brucella phage EF4 TaxID=2706778 RepID=A0A6C0X1E6_9CAUD|nr:structural protein [Brucella phage EF4]
MSYDNVIQDFSVGEVITGDTSGAEGTVSEILPGGGLVLKDIVNAKNVSGGSFLDNEMLTGDQGGSAQAASVLSNIVPGVAFPDGLTTADMSYVWAFKNRLWFAQKESLNIWYMDAPDAVGGDPVVYPMGGILTLGGSVLWGRFMVYGNRCCWRFV